MAEGRSNGMSCPAAGHEARPGALQDLGDVQKMIFDRIHFLNIFLKI